jgi:hypothetical protein
MAEQHGSNDGSLNAPSLLGDSIHWQDNAERVVRPALAVLYRIAVGPGADRYAPRFIAFEQSGVRPGWHWPSLFFPAVWAFYRRLWLSGIMFSLLSVAGAFALVALGPRIDDAHLPWLVAAALAIWLVPGVIAALCANSLLYRRVRRLVRRAESVTRSATKAATLVTSYRPTSPLGAVLLGAVALAVALAMVGPGLRASYDDARVRAKVGASLAAARALQDEVVATWTTSRLVPRQTDNDALRSHQGARHISEAEVSPANGRVRLVLAPSLPELAGKAILLAPALDGRERVQWLCIPVDIPARYLPAECRAR